MNESFHQKEMKNIREADMEKIVHRVQEIYITSAEKYLSENEELKRAVIDYYSNTERLKRELSNVFAKLSKDEIEKRIHSIARIFEDKEKFIDEVSKHLESYQSTTERENSFARRNKRMRENPKATKNERRVRSWNI